MEKIKVLNVISDTNIGGAGKCVINYCKNRNKDKYDIVVVMPKDSLLKPEIEESGTRIIEIDGLKDKSLDISAIGKLKKIIKEEAPQIVHTHASLSARIAAKLYGKCKIIYTRHCDFPISPKYKYKIVRFANRFVNESLANKIIVTSIPTKENLMKQGLTDEKIEVVINGVNELNKISDEEKNKIKKQYNISDDEIVVGYLARVEELKGHKYLIEAAKILDEKKDSDKKFKFLIMGTGSYEDTAKNMVKELNLEEKVIFTGFIKDVEKMFNITDIQINASYLSEGTTLSMLEGMSLGIPTVATKCGGNPYVIENEINGFLVEKADSKSLADGIEKIIENKERFDKMKENSKEVFKKKYTSKIYAENIEKIYESMVK